MHFHPLTQNTIKAFKSSAQAIFSLLETVLPFARKFPCKRKFWYLQNLQGKMQGIKIDKEIARKSSLKQGN
jgi:hypothetical protein